MKNILSAIILSSIILFSSQSFAQENNPEKAKGNWSGEIELPGSKLEIIFHVSVEEMQLFSTMDVPAQGAKGLKVDKTTTTSDSLIFEITMIMGKFAGQFENDSSVSGTWSQRGMNFPLTIKKTNSVTQILRPQTPQPPFPYISEEVEYVNPTSGLKLAGTLTLPKNNGQCPAIILISGSGAQDRDETLLGHKPFFVIADFLARNGIAVLRVDDRGVGDSEGNISEATSEDFAGDVIAGIEFLKLKKEIAVDKIGLIGHSEGGIIAPMVAIQSNDVAYIILMAGPGVPGGNLIYKQVELVSRGNGLSEEQINQNIQTQKEIFRILKNENDPDKRLEDWRNILTRGMYSQLAEEQKNTIDTQLNELNSPWYYFFITYDPYPALTKIKCPVLALNGDKDIQVPSEQNMEVIKKALTEGGNKNFEIVELENLNHLFQHCKLCTIEEYAQIEETISPEVLELVKNWIWKVTMK